MSRTGSRNGTTGSRRLRSGVGAIAAACVLSLGFGVSAQAAGELELGPEGFSAKAVKLLSVSPTDETVEEVTQAGAHPDALLLQFGLKTLMAGNGEMPTTTIRDLEIELPPGMSGNPEATPKCTMDQVETQESSCPRASIVGFHELDFNGGRGVFGGLTTTLYNVVPPKGVVARFAMKVLPVPVVLDMRVNSDGRYTITTKIKNISQVLSLIRSRTYLFGTPANLNGTGGDWRGGFGNPGQGRPVPLLTMGTECGPALPVRFRARSWENGDHWAEASYTPSAGLSGCDKLRFRPTLDLRPSHATPAAPAGVSVRVDVPQTSSPTGLATPNLRKVEVEMPEGVAINPSSVHGLVGCTDEQSAIRSLDDPSCPAASRIGSVRIETPVLAGPMEGSVYLGAPKSMDSQSGEMFRVFLAASGYGVTIKQEGKITPDPVTGRLRAVFDNAPQQPFSSMEVNFNDGPRAPLSNPSSCGTFTTKAKLSSWSGQSAESLSSFEIDCLSGLGTFAPTLLAGSANPTAGVSAPFNLSIGKPDGQSPLTGVQLTLPKGLLANLKGNLGQQVGSTTAVSGLGSSPFPFPGKVYLEGPYGDAPFSLKVVVPAVAGPYDLGNVVVKQKLYIDSKDAHVTVVSDPLPTILQGVPVQLQRLDVSVDKPGFMINPTSCEPQAVSGTVSSSTGQTAAVSNRFQVGGCGDLGYRPALDLALSGDAKELKNGGHPQLDANLATKPGEANQRKVEVTLPLNLALDPDNAKALCEPVDAAKNACPAGSIVGKASAVSVLDVPLEGPVYFVRGERRTATGKIAKTLPDLMIPLSGQGVTIVLNASSYVSENKLQTTFDNLPDAPISSFGFTINGGANGILKVTNGDVCKSTTTPKVGQAFVGQNGKGYRVTNTLTAGCKLAVVKTKQAGGRVNVTVGGLQPGQLSLRGKGVQANSRSIAGGTTVASLGVTLDRATRARLKAGRNVKLRLTATVKPSGKKAVKVTSTVTLKAPRKAAKKAAKKAAAAKR